MVSADNVSGTLITDGGKECSSFRCSYNLFSCQVFICEFSALELRSQREFVLLDSHRCMTLERTGRETFYSAKLWCTTAPCILTRSALMYMGMEWVTSAIIPCCLSMQFIICFHLLASKLFWVQSVVAANIFFIMMRHARLVQLCRGISSSGMTRNRCVERRRECQLEWMTKGLDFKTHLVLMFDREGRGSKWEGESKVSLLLRMLFQRNHTNRSKVGFIRMRPMPRRLLDILAHAKAPWYISIINF